QRDDKFQRRVRRGKADYFDVFQASLAASGENIVFGDVLLAFWVNDPERGRAADGFRDVGQSSEIPFRIRGEKDTLPIRRGLPPTDVLREPGYFTKKLRLELAQQRDSVAGFNAELLDARLRMQYFFAPLFSGRAKMENR